MKLYDLHQDLMSHIRFRDTIGQTQQTDFESLEASVVDLVIATAFPLPEDESQTNPKVHDLISEELAMYITALQTLPSWQLVRTKEDLQSDKKKLLLHIEGLNIFSGSSADWEQLESWYKQGVRSIATHWNIENLLGGGTDTPTQSLTDLGAEVILYLEEKSLLFDMAHMGRKTFFDAVRIATRPLYVSHGNADAVCSSIRNYTDEQLSCIARTDGVIGVFFPNTFVVGKDKQGDINDVVAHFVYLKQTIGIRHIAIGSDFGGIVSGCVAGLDHVSALPILMQALQVAGFTDTELETISHKNAKRIIESHLS